jgi:kinesin family protein C1
MHTQVLDSKVVGSLLRRACKARATAATESNERSSRSHCVFTLKVKGVNEASQQETEGVYVCMYVCMYVCKE